MALIDEVKTALRVSLEDEDINLQIQSLINASKEDLIYTADINENLVEQDECPALIKLAIITFVKANWTDDETEAERVMRSYNSIKGKLSISSYFSNYEE